MTIRAARAGKHIIAGKPMAMTVDEADGMVAAVEAAGVTSIPMQALMRLRGAGLRARIDRGDIGDLVLLHQTARWSIAEDWYRSGRPGWFADPRHVPGGAFIDEGIYWMIGSSSASLRTRSACRRRRRSTISSTASRAGPLPSRRCATPGNRSPLAMATYRSAREGRRVSCAKMTRA